MGIDRIGNFQVIAPLGTGAHSTILHVRRNDDSKHYALKVVPIDGGDDHKFLEQAQHEFAVAQMLDHANLIKVYALETQRDWLFRIRKAHLLIEYVNGKTLDMLLGKLSMARLVQVFVAVAAGLVHMHRRQVFHADLKPNNIMLGSNGTVKVIDYGLAWIKGENKGRVQGTPEYMAPEQALKKTVNERSDIYNFGATMYRLVTGKLPPNPIENAGIMDTRMWERQIKPVRQVNPAAPAELAELIHRCLAFSAKQRPERVSEVQGTLDRLADQLVKSPEDQLETTEES